MKAEEINNNLPKDYLKQASRDCSVFTSSIFGETYVKSFKELFGLEFPSIFWVVRGKRKLTFYRSQKDHDNLREGFGKLLLNKEFVFKVVDKLRYYTDWINNFLIRNSTSDLFNQNKEDFCNHYREFFAYHQIVCWGGDYLADVHQELEESINALKDIYAYNEKVVPDVEEYLARLGIDHLKYNEAEGSGKDVGLFFFNDREVVSLYGEELDKVESFIIGLDQRNLNLQKLKGLSVSAGKVQGKIRVIKDPIRLNEVQEGDILVTGMTRPQFNPLLQKCKAIVTDEGNILSHAAILARETKIPCIVRTRIATEVFKDGEQVEVDADEGVVRKLTKT